MLDNIPYDSRIETWNGKAYIWTTYGVDRPTNYMLTSLIGQSKHIIHLWGGYPTNKNYDSDIFNEQSTPKLLRDKHTKTKLTFMHVSTMILFFKRKNYRGEWLNSFTWKKRHSRLPWQTQQNLSLLQSFLIIYWKLVTIR